MLDTDQRRLLGDFIRGRRERARPEAPGGRRRTPGLRREELAARAGISATWCAWIEQGREVQASPEALGRIARALSLSAAERAYLFELAGRIDPETPSSPIDSTPRSLRAFVGAAEHPAYALDCFWNACCWNDTAADLFAGWLDGEHQRNLLRFVFCDDAARSLIPDWEARALRLLAEFRADYGHMFRDVRVKRFVDALRDESPLFARAWDAQDVLHREGGLRAFDHPVSGRLWFEQHSFTPADAPAYRLVLLVPGDDDGGLAHGDRTLGDRKK
ncbi:helix-turn-helix transcriptional regulator [Methylocystis parvus]|uniref:Helix-turn-helix domain-containing protein n=1 Tax=Methylocystis parvus TaxID=134 RepID=A0A6B8MAZ3_9HYPH|nr:helix-turn-helix transcriptional regulator [Methylocystis parvus]QGM98749.1 helix-turn-helix domain-containing protein [Methylocystis parvus]WBK00899.1 helix-turn-helix transcriptional regulator [Methylocystis parvus OBBP]